MFSRKKIKTNMELEIKEQATVILGILKNYIDNNKNINIDLPKNIKKIVIVASGSSYHCARFAVDFIESFSKIETRAIYSSEFLLKDIIPKDENTLYIFITQSGETSDTLQAVKRVKKETKLPTLCITNVIDSSIWNACEYKVACHAGEEKGIAATKSFTSQMLCLILISLKLIENTEYYNAHKEVKDSLFELPDIINKTINKHKEIKKIAKYLSKEKTIVITADGIAYSLAKEGALKIKETSYKNISASILGEFMHGHVAVLNNKSTLIYISIENILERSINNLNKIKKDYNPTLIIVGKGNEHIKTDFHIYIECKNKIQQLFSNVVVLQLLALETALKLKCNVDNPKGLHKIVVENSIN